MTRQKKQLEIKIGEKFRWYDRDIWHIIGFVQDGDQVLVALKSWARVRSKWVYRLESKEIMEEWFNEYNKETK